MTGEKEGREGRKETQWRERIREKIVRNWKGGMVGMVGGGVGGCQEHIFACLALAEHQQYSRPSRELKQISCTGKQDGFSSCVNICNMDGDKMIYDTTC
jgi:hypothetical protein